MDAATRTAITAAAVNATGPMNAFTSTTKVEQADGSVVEVITPDPGAWEAAIHENAINIALMAEENGLVGKALNGVDTTRTEVKVFSGTIVGVRKEAKSTRGVITLHTGSTGGPARNDAITKQPLPEGVEQVRTERTDSIIGKNMALKARDLLGHKVLVWVEVEQIQGGSTKVRVLRHVTSMGVDPSAGDKGLGNF